MLSYFGSNWGSGLPRFRADQMIGYTRKVVNADGAVNWDVPVELKGIIISPTVAALGQAFH